MSSDQDDQYVIKFLINPEQNPGVHSLPSFTCQVLSFPKKHKYNHSHLEEIFIPLIPHNLRVRTSTNETDLIVELTSLVANTDKDFFFELSSLSGPEYLLSEAALEAMTSQFLHNWITALRRIRRTDLNQREMLEPIIEIKIQLLTFTISQLCKRNYHFQILNSIFLNCKALSIDISDRAKIGACFVHNPDSPIVQELNGLDFLSHLSSVLIKSFNFETQTISGKSFTKSINRDFCAKHIKLDDLKEFNEFIDACLESYNSHTCSSTRYYAAIDHSYLCEKSLLSEELFFDNEPSTTITTCGSNHERTSTQKFIRSMDSFMSGTVFNESNGQPDQKAFITATAPKDLLPILHQLPDGKKIIEKMEIHFSYYSECRINVNRYIPICDLHSVFPTNDLNKELTNNFILEIIKAMKLRSNFTDHHILPSLKAKSLTKLQELEKFQETYFD